MFKRLLILAHAIYVAGLITGYGFGYTGILIDEAFAQSDSNSPTGKVELKTVNAAETVFGIKIGLVDKQVTLPVLLTVTCNTKEETPELAISTTEYPSEALLHSVGLDSYGCYSYEIVFTNGKVDISVSAEWVENSINVEGRNIITSGIFVFNSIEGNWTKAKGSTSNASSVGKQTATLTKQHNKLISGLVSLPNKLTADPVKFDQSAILQPISDLSPTQGYFNIATPEGNPYGTASTKLPRFLRPVRGVQPSYSIDYSSNSVATGVLGKGITLHTPSIEVMTQSGSPPFWDSVESEDYLINGEELVALDSEGNDVKQLYMGGPIINRINPRIFKLKNNSSGKLIIRHGDFGSYFWEVWDPGSQLTSLYGAKKMKGVRNSFPTIHNGSILSVGKKQIKWGLSHEYENSPTGTLVNYEYESFKCDPRAFKNTKTCLHQLRVDHIVYNDKLRPWVAGDLGISGITKLDFNWVKKIDPRRYTSQGTHGLLVVDQHWLDSIEVKYGATLGAFDKLFSKHEFVLSDGKDSGLFFEKVLQEYKIIAASQIIQSSDGIKEKPEPQVFKFKYNGQGEVKALNWPRSEATVKDLGDGVIPLLKAVGFGGLVEPSAVGTSESESSGGSLYLGIGPITMTSLKTPSVGLKVGLDFNESSGRNIRVDISGDGIEDTVILDGSKQKYCKGKRTSFTVPKFNNGLAGKLENYEVKPTGVCGIIAGITKSSESSSKTEAIGIEGHVNGAFVALARSKTKSKTSSYFVNLDKDMLLDFVHGGVPFFNQGEKCDAGNVNCNIEFSRNSAVIPPISAANSDLLKDYIPSALVSELEKANGVTASLISQLNNLTPSHVTVAWQAPFSGLVQVNTEFPDIGTNNIDAPNAEIASRNKDLLTIKKRLTDIQNKFKGTPEGQALNNLSAVKTAERKLYLSISENGKVRSCSPSGALDETLVKENLGNISPVTTEDLNKFIKETTSFNQCLTAGHENTLGSTDKTSLFVKAGTVVYVTLAQKSYDSEEQGPPHVNISYQLVDGDEIFNSTLIDRLDDTLTDQDLVSNANIPDCFWAITETANFKDSCAFSAVSKYQYDLKRDLVPSSQNLLELRDENGGRLSGEFSMPMNLIKSFNPTLYLDYALTAADLLNINRVAQRKQLFSYQLNRICESPVAEDYVTCTRDADDRARIALKGRTICNLDESSSCKTIPDAFGIGENRFLKLGLKAPPAAKLTKLVWHIPPKLSFKPIETKLHYSEIPVESERGAPLPGLAVQSGSVVATEFKLSVKIPIADFISPLELVMIQGNLFDGKEVRQIPLPLSCKVDQSNYPDTKSATIQGEACELEIEGDGHCDTLPNDQCMFTVEYQFSHEGVPPIIDIGIRSVGEPASWLKTLTWEKSELESFIEIESSDNSGVNLKAVEFETQHDGMPLRSVSGKLAILNLDKKIDLRLSDGSDTYDVTASEFCSQLEAGQRKTWLGGQVMGELDEACVIELIELKTCDDDRCFFSKEKNLDELAISLVDADENQVEQDQYTWIDAVSISTVYVDATETVDNFSSGFYKLPNAPNIEGDVSRRIEFSYPIGIGEAHLSVEVKDLQNGLVSQSHLSRKFPAQSSDNVSCSVDKCSVTISHCGSDESNDNANSLNQKQCLFTSRDTKWVRVSGAPQDSELKIYSTGVSIIPSKVEPKLFAQPIQKIGTTDNFRLVSGKLSIEMPEDLLVEKIEESKRIAFLAENEVELVIKADGLKAATISLLNECSSPSSSSQNIIIDSSVSGSCTLTLEDYSQCDGDVADCFFADEKEIELSAIIKRKGSSRKLGFRWLESLATASLIEVIENDDPLELNSYLPVDFAQDDSERLFLNHTESDLSDLDTVRDRAPKIQDALLLKNLRKTEYNQVVENESEFLTIAEKRLRNSLCLIVEEVISKLESAGEELYDLDEEFSKHSDHCEKIFEELGKLKVRGKLASDLIKPDKEDRLELKGEQITKVQIEDLIKKLSQKEVFYLDQPILTSRGYRLPAKINPTDCVDIDGSVDETCRFRLSFNFAMSKRSADLAKLFNETARERLKVLGNGQDAYKVKLIAYGKDGTRIKFKELTPEHPSDNKHRNEKEVASSAPYPSCVGYYSNYRWGPFLSFGKDFSGYPTKGDAPFGLIQPLSRFDRAVAFSNSIADKGKNSLTRKEPYKSLIELEKKQDCKNLRSDVVPYIEAPIDNLSFGITDENKFIGRDRVFEFEASPGELVYFDTVIEPVLNEFNYQGRNISGYFSVVERFDDSNKSLGVEVFPRDSQELFSLKQQEKVFNRPWEELLSAEIFLGSSFRTFSDVSMKPVKQSGGPKMSVEARRDMLRLFPEIRVPAHFIADSAINGKYTLKEVVEGFLSESNPEFAHFLTRPSLEQYSDTWSLFAQTRKRDTAFTVAEKPFSTLRRANENLVGNLGSQTNGVQKSLNAANGACGQASARDACQSTVKNQSDGAPNPWEYIKYTPLVHRFVGPNVENNLINDSLRIQQTPICESTEVSKENASCWIGADDTTYISQKIVKENNGQDLTVRTGLFGHEDVLVSQLKDALEDYSGLIDQALNRTLLVVNPIDCIGIDCKNIKSSRPLPQKNVVPMVGVIKRSETESYAFNAGAAFINSHVVFSDSKNTVDNIDLNGDRCPDRIEGSVAVLTSPVCVPRLDWWRLFRGDGVDPNPAAINSTLTAGPGYEISSDTSNTGLGAGLSPSTAAMFKKRSTPTASTDANLEPSFNLSWALGQQNALADLQDFNGDGLPDAIKASLPNKSISVKYNIGSGLDGETSIHGVQPTRGLNRFGSNQQLGFGVRVGFSNDNGAIAGGSGIAYSNSGSEGLFMDFTRDGRTDIVIPSTEKGKLFVYPNLGNGFGDPVEFNIKDWIGQATNMSESTIVDAGVAYTATIPAVFFTVVINPAIKTSQSVTKQLLRIADVNADGFPDVSLVKGFWNGNKSVIPDLSKMDGSKLITFYNPTAKHGLLESITNPTGSKITISYDLKGNTGPEHSTNLWAMTAVEEEDTYEPSKLSPAVSYLAPDGDDIVKTEYLYSGGYHQRIRNSFYGYAQVIKKISAADKADNGKFKNLKTFASEYTNGDFYTKGKNRRQTTLDPNVEPGTKKYAVLDSFETGMAIESYDYNSKNTAKVHSSSGLHTDFTTQVNARKHGFEACGADIEGCIKQYDAVSLSNRLLVNEYKNFWSQPTSATVRDKLTSLSVFDSKNIVEENTDYVESLTNENKLLSAAGYDYNQWGQISTYYDFTDKAEVYAEIDYANGLERLPQDPPPTGSTTQFPISSLADHLLVRGGAERGSGDILRNRETIYNEDQGAVIDRVCEYNQPQERGTCKSFSEAMDRNIVKYTVEDSLKRAYKKAKINDAEGNNDVVVLHTVAAYDEYSNATHVISPLNQHQDWIERRYSYEQDPFKSSSSKTSITRCVGKQQIGLGLSTPGANEQCTFGSDEPLISDSPISSVTHQSEAIYNPHFGSVGITKDVNRNATLIDYDAWGRVSLLARNWGNDPTQGSVNIRQSVQHAQSKLNSNDTWQPYATVEYAAVSDGTNQIFSAHKKLYGEPDYYRGNYPNDELHEASVRESAIISDGGGTVIQQQVESEICDKLDLSQPSSKNWPSGICINANVANIRIIPGAKLDGLGREIETYETYAVLGAEDNNYLLAKDDSAEVPLLGASNDDYFKPLQKLSYDAADRPLKIITRLSQHLDPSGKKEFSTQQYLYEIPRKNVFSTWSMSPRCTLSRTNIDARGVIKETAEDLKRFYPTGAANLRQPRTRSADGEPYKRMYESRECGSLASDVNLNSISSSSGLLTKVSYQYDPLRQLRGVEFPVPVVDETDASKEIIVTKKISTDYDLLGRRIRFTDPNAGTTELIYDATSNLVEEANCRGESCDQVAEKWVNRKIYSYAADRLLQIDYKQLETKRPSEEDIKSKTRYYYDTLPLAANLEGLKNKRAQEGLQALIGDPDQCTNCIGSVTAIEDRTGARLMQYNELGQLSNRWYSILDRGKLLQDNGGNRYFAEIGRFAESTQYSSFGDVTSQRLRDLKPAEPSNRCKSGQYDEVCGSDNALHYGYSQDGKLSSLSFNKEKPTSASFAYDALGRLSAKTTGLGIVSRYSYDEQDLLLNQAKTANHRKKSDQTLQDIEYQYEAGGNLSDSFNSADADYSSVFSYLYDPANRIESFLSKIGSEVTEGKYGYDIAHRVRAREVNGSKVGVNNTYHYTADNRVPLHAPSSIDFHKTAEGVKIENDVELNYDLLGRLSEPQGGSDSSLTERVHSWDAESRLIQVRLLDSEAKERYVYNDSGQRVLKYATDQDGKTQIMLYPTPFYARSYSKPGSYQVSVNNLPIANVDLANNNTTTYLLSDLATGSVNTSVQLPAQSFNEPFVARREYSPYGLTLPLGNADNLHAFHGKELDKNTGYSYFGARYYSKDLGVWLKPDPILYRYLNGSINGGVYNARNLASYSFAGSNPINITDKDGEALNFLIGGLKGGLENAVIQGIEIQLGMRDEFSFGELAGDALMATATSGLSTLKNTARVANIIAKSRKAMKAKAIKGAKPLADVLKKSEAITKGGVSPSTLHKRGKIIPGGRKIDDTLAGSNKIKNANGKTFKRVDFAPSKPHSGLSPHTHPNFRNKLPDGTIKSGVSKHGQPVTRKDIIDAARKGGQRTGGN